MQRRVDSMKLYALQSVKERREKSGTEETCTTIVDLPEYNSCQLQGAKYKLGPIQAEGRSAVEKRSVSCFGGVWIEWRLEGRGECSLGGLMRLNTSPIGQEITMHDLPLMD